MRAVKEFRKGDSLRAKPRGEWNLYIAECADGSYYTGIAKDVEKRIEAHNLGKGARYTATHGPVKLVFQESQADYSAALRREYQVKTLPKKRKVQFVAGEDLPRPSLKSKMSFQKNQRLTIKIHNRNKAGRSPARRKKV
jgi:putative endonuclease